MENLILYDWVSITSKIHSPDDFIRMLGLNKDNISWEKVKGAHGYRDRLYWQSISIHYNGSEDMGIWLEMSGQGCRAFESYGTGDFDALFSEVLDNPDDMHITRLDVAFDDHTGILDIDEICKDAENQMYISRTNAWQVTRSDSGNSVTHGSRASEILIRIYDKAAERGFEDGRHWVRVELQLRRERARAFLASWRSRGVSLPVSSETISGTLLNLILLIQIGADGL